MSVLNIQMILTISANASIGTMVYFHLILNLHVQGRFYPNAKTVGVSNRNIYLFIFGIICKLCFRNLHICQVTYFRIAIGAQAMLCCFC